MASGKRGFSLTLLKVCEREKGENLVSGNRMWTVDFCLLVASLLGSFSCFFRFVIHHHVRHRFSLPFTL